MSTLAQTFSNGVKPDQFGRVWPKGYGTCPVCEQPDDCGDCNHVRLNDNEIELIVRGES